MQKQHGISDHMTSYDLGVAHALVQPFGRNFGKKGPHSNFQQKTGFATRVCVTPTFSWFAIASVHKMMEVSHTQRWFR